MPWSVRTTSSLMVYSRRISSPPPRITRAQNSQAPSPRDAYNLTSSRSHTITTPTAAHHPICRLSSTPSPTVDFSSALSGTPTLSRRPRCPHIRQSPLGSSRHPRSARRGHHAPPRSLQRPPQQTRAKGMRIHGASWDRGSGRAHP